MQNARRHPRRSTKSDRRLREVCDRQKLIVSIGSPYLSAMARSEGPHDRGD